MGPCSSSRSRLLLPRPWKPPPRLLAPASAGRSLPGLGLVPDYPGQSSHCCALDRRSLTAARLRPCPHPWNQAAELHQAPPSCPVAAGDHDQCRPSSCRSCYPPLLCTDGPCVRGFASSSRRLSADDHQEQCCLHLGALRPPPRYQRLLEHPYKRLKPVILVVRRQDKQTVLLSRVKATGREPTTGNTNKRANTYRACHATARVTWTSNQWRYQNDSPVNDIHGQTLTEKCEWRR